jgi:hypothetical protein
MEVVMTKLKAWFVRGVPSTLVALSCACSGTVLDVGGKDAGACTEITCPAGDVWDSLICDCVTAHASCTAPASCPVGEVFDAFQCACIVKPTPPASDASAPPTGDASSPTQPAGDATLDGLSPTGDAEMEGGMCAAGQTYYCCVLGPSGCTESSSTLFVACGSELTCGEPATTATTACPPACTPGDAEDSGDAGCCGDAF